MSDRHTIWTNRIIALFDKGLALLEQRNVKINGRSATELRRQVAERRPQQADRPAGGKDPFRDTL